MTPKDALRQQLMLGIIRAFSGLDVTATRKKQIMNTDQQHETRDAWNEIAEGYDRFVTPTHEWLGSEGLRRCDVRAGMKFLDVAAGSGALTIPAARLGAQVLATDLSPRMLERLEARARREGLAIETRVMDGHSLDLPDDAFDVCGSQFGVMLFPDLPRGVGEMARVTKKGGRVLLIAYGDPQKIEFFGFFVRAIRAAVPGFTGPNMDPPPLPLQLQDPVRVERELAGAGLTDVRVDTITETLEFASGQDLWEWIVNSNPLARAILADARVTEDREGLIRNALDDLVRERSGGAGTAALTNPIHIGIGVK